MPPEIAKLLWDMLDAVQAIEQFTAGKTFDDYLSDRMMRAAVERQFEIIGEAMSRLMKQDADCAHRITEHRKIRGFRNNLAHGYDAIDHRISWNIVVSKLPILHRDIERILPLPDEMD
jgi:uncharacterized protein with HEPN domain